MTFSGAYSSYFMRGTLKNLSDMQHLSEEDFPYRKQVFIGSLMGKFFILCIITSMIHTKLMGFVNFEAFIFLYGFTGETRGHWVLSSFSTIHFPIFLG